MTGTRVNLHLYVTESGRLVYYVMHIGIFPKPIAENLAKNIDARGLASGSRYANQTGRVDVVTCDLGDTNSPDVVASSQDYTPRDGEISA